MDIIMHKLALWLQHQKPGTVIKMRDFLIHYISPLMGIATFQAQLRAVVYRKNGDVEDRGIVSAYAVTDVFLQHIVDTLQSADSTFSDYKYHDSGTGTTAESTSDTDLVTPCGESRDIGTQTEGATANIYRSVATHTYAGTFAIAEHCLFNAPTGGNALDRSVLSAVINVDASDRIEWNYQLTCSSG